jgi:Cu2+-exporting ATPase
MNDLAHPSIIQTGVGNEVVHFLVPDVRCAGCCLKIESELGAMPGINDVNVNYAEKRLSFVPDSVADTDEAIARLTRMGYASSKEVANVSLEMFKAERRKMLARLGVAGIGMMQAMMFALTGYLAGPAGIEDAYQDLMRWAGLVVAAPIVFYSAMPFHRGALRDLRNGTLGMDVPVSLAIAAAFTLSSINTILGTGEVYFDSACMFTFFLLTGRFLELTARQSFHVEQSLGDHLLPESAVLQNGETLALSELSIGDVVIVEAGEAVPADAIVVSGATSVDESAFTGESKPLIKTPGTKVLAGSHNLDGRIEIRVTALKPEWVITHLAELYKKSASYRPDFAILADVIAKYFVSVILVLAFGSSVYWWLQGAPDFFAIGLAVLVVSCPCALSLATPVAYTIASGAVRKLGVLVSNGAFLEKLNSVDAVVFDKTGTLTEGELNLEQIEFLDPAFTERQVLNIAGALEATSLHPIAATLRSMVADVVDVERAEVEPGTGVKGTIDGADFRLGRPGSGIDKPDDGSNWVLLTRDTVPVCWFGFSDKLRSGAGDVIANMQQRITSVEVYSGDGSKAGKEKMQVLGIDSPSMNMRPDDKISGLRARQQAGDRVLMVGDGLNDAGAMAVADISLAVNPVDTVVQSAADATLVSGDLENIPALFDYAARVNRVIRQNLTWAFVYNLSVIPLAIMGLIAPWVAALGMSMSSLLVTLNACRLARVPSGEGNR